MMAGIGLASIFIHCVGGTLIHGFNVGFTALGSRAFGADNKIKYKQFFKQGLTNLAILLILFTIFALSSFKIMKMTGQSDIIA